MIIPSPPVRGPGQTDEEWHEFLRKYRTEVVDPIGIHIKTQASFGLMGLVSTAIITIIMLYLLGR